MTITGAGMDSTEITAGSLSRVFLVYGGTFTLRNLTVRDGNISGEGGGAIAYAGTDTAGIVLDSVRLTGNVASSGGAVFCNDCGGISVTDSVIANNHANDANGEGGGIWMEVTFVNSSCERAESKLIRRRACHVS